MIGAAGLAAAERAEDFDAVSSLKAQVAMNSGRQRSRLNFFMAGSRCDLKQNSREIQTAAESFAMILDRVLAKHPKPR